MPVTIIVGGQYGSEGKGKVAHWFARELGASAVVRIGGANSGHTVIDELGQVHVFRHLPTAAILPDTLCVLAAGSYIDPAVLLSEIDRIGLPRERLVIDPNALVVTEDDRRIEQENRLRDRIGSTTSGTGAAVMRRIRREPDTVFAIDHPDLKGYVRSTRHLLTNLLARNSRILIEGTQGYGLSLLQSPHFPYVTSRDTTAAGFLSEVGLSPLDVDDVILVLRSHPIRVAGNSGPLPKETKWDAIAAKSGNDKDICERTSVTQQVRRVARFDSEIVREAILANRPTRVVLNHLDHIDVGMRSGKDPSFCANEFLTLVEAGIQTKIDYVGTGRAQLSHRESIGATNKESCGGSAVVGST